MSEAIPKAIIRAIHEKTQNGSATLRGSTIARQGDSWVLIHENGEVYVISIRPGRIIVADAPRDGE